MRNVSRRSVGKQDRRQGVRIGAICEYSPAKGDFVDVRHLITNGGFGFSPNEDVKCVFKWTTSLLEKGHKTKTVFVLLPIMIGLESLFGEEVSTKLPQAHVDYVEVNAIGRTEGGLNPFSK